MGGCAESIAQALYGLIGWLDRSTEPTHSIHTQASSGGSTAAPTRAGPSGTPTSSRWSCSRVRSTRSPTHVVSSGSFRSVDRLTPVLLPSTPPAVFLVGPLCLWAAYAVQQRKPYRHLLQVRPAPLLVLHRVDPSTEPTTQHTIHAPGPPKVVISTAELYGGFMTFVPDILDGAPSLASRTQEPVLFWVYLVFMNGCVWLVPWCCIDESPNKQPLPSNLPTPPSPTNNPKGCGSSCPCSCSGSPARTSSTPARWPRRSTSPSANASPGCPPPSASSSWPVRRFGLMWCGCGVVWYGLSRCVCRLTILNPHLGRPPRNTHKHTQPSWRSTACWYRSSSS